MMALYRICSIVYVTFAVTYAAKSDKNVHWNEVTDFTTFASILRYSTFIHSMIDAVDKLDRNHPMPLGNTIAG